MVALAIVLSLVLGGAALPAVAQAPDDSRPPVGPEDLQELQYDLANLEALLGATDVRDARYAALQQRLDWLREDVRGLGRELGPRGATPADRAGEQLAQLRSEVASLQKDLARSSERWTPEGTVPSGTELEVRLTTPLSSRRASATPRALGAVVRPLLADGHLLIPAGTPVEGVVTAAEPAERRTQGDRVEVVFDRVVLDDGRVLPLPSRVVSVAARGERVVVDAAGGLVSSAGTNLELPVGTIVRLRLERPLALAEWYSRP